MKTYFSIFFPVKEGGYGIIFPDFPEIATQGDDFADCMCMSADALKTVVEDMVEKRESLPEPCTYETALAAAKEIMKDEGTDHTRQPLLQLVAAPAIDDTPVRITISLTKGQLENIDRAAKSSGLTRSGYLVRAAQAYA